MLVLCVKQSGPTSQNRSPNSYLKKVLLTKIKKEPQPGLELNTKKPLDELGENLTR